MSGRHRGRRLRRLSLDSLLALSIGAYFLLALGVLLLKWRHLL